MFDFLQALRKLAKRKEKTAVQPKVYSLYEIVHGITGRRYIGHSGDMGNRMAVHFCHLKYAKHANDELQRDYDKDGDVFFVNTIATYLDKQMAMFAEHMAVKADQGSYNVYLKV